MDEKEVYTLFCRLHGATVNKKTNPLTPPNPHPIKGEIRIADAPVFDRRNATGLLFALGSNGFQDLGLTTAACSHNVPCPTHRRISRSKGRERVIYEYVGGNGPTCSNSVWSLA